MYKIIGINDGVEFDIIELRGESLIGFDAEIKENINRISTLDFSIPATNVNYDKMQKLKTEVVVVDVDRDVEVFRGRVLEDLDDFYNTKTCSCESTLAYLVDSRHPPYLNTKGISAFIGELLDEHNSKVEDKQKIYPGNITVVDPNDYMYRESKYHASPLSIIQDKIVSSYGGLLQIRRTNGKNYLDYLADYPISDQEIRFGENLLDFTKEAMAETIRTVIIPLGAEDEETEERLDITSVNDGKNYLVDWDLVAEYGWIEDTIEFDDVTIAANLLKKGQQYLDECKNIIPTIELTAVDGRALGMDVKRIYPGVKVKVISKPHGLDTYFLCTSKTTNLFAPDKDKITLGNIAEGYTDSTIRKRKAASDKVESFNTSLSKKIQNIKDDFKTAIENAGGLYKTEVKQSDSSYIIYYHNKEKMADSDILMTFNDVGFALSADGGNTWYGMQVNGTMIADILNTTGVNANWIDVGILKSIEINNGNDTFKVDVNGNVTANSLTSTNAKITGGSINITTSSETYDVITLSYGDWTMALSPLELNLKNTKTGRIQRVQANGAYYSDLKYNDLATFQPAGAFFYDSNGNMTATYQPKAMRYYADGIAMMYLDETRLIYYTDGAEVARLDKNGLHYGSGETTITHIKTSAVSIFTLGIICGKDSAFSDNVFSVMGNGRVRDDFQVDGTLFTKSGGVATASDRSVKNSIEDLDADFCLNFIMSLEPSSYKYNDGTSGRYHHGFVADRVKAAMGDNDWGVYCDVVISDMVETITNEETGESETVVVEEGKTISVLRYEELIAPIVKVIQLQQKKLQIQQSKIEELEATLEKVMAFINYTEGG